MANFLITSPDTLAQGTDQNDVFVIQTALLSTLVGNGGADVMTAGINGGTRTTIQGGEGNDRIEVSGATASTFNQMFIGGGADNDLVSANFFVGLNSTVNGGGGNDTINAGFVVDSALVINGNAGDDQITVSGGLAGSGLLVAAGGGNDTISLSAAVEKMTIAGGGGADVISATIIGAAISSLRIEGDTIGDSEFFGNDIVAVGGAIGSSSLINAGGGGDVFTISATLADNFTVNGNEGRDTITVSGALTNTGLVNGGAAADVINIGAGAGIATSTTVNGGGGADTISVGGAAFAGTLVGGTEADKFNLANASATDLRYVATDLSTLAATDFVSSNIAIGAGTAFTINQDLIKSAFAANGGNANVSATLGVATFTGTFNGELSARVVELDKTFTQGATIAFQDGAGNSYVFLQTGAQGGGVESDVVIRTDKLAAGFGIPAGLDTTAISVNY